MSAPLAGKFQDHYKVLEVDAKSDSETIANAYGTAAKDKLLEQMLSELENGKLYRGAAWTPPEPVKS